MYTSAIKKTSNTQHILIPLPQEGWVFEYRIILLLTGCYSNSSITYKLGKVYLPILLVLYKVLQEVRQFDLISNKCKGHNHGL